MKLPLFAAGLALGLPLLAPKAGPRRGVSPSPGAASAPTPAPASVAVARVDVTFRKTSALVITELTLEPPPGARDLFVAYGSPGLPAAFAAELLAVPEGRFSPAADATGVELASEHAPRAGGATWLALGPATSAGRVVHLDAQSLEGLAKTALLAIRFRSVHALSDRDGHPRSVVARVSRDGAALPLSQVSVGAEGATLEDASASLCTVRGEETALTLAFRAPTGERAAPLRARRGPGQELCVRATVK